MKFEIGQTLRNKVSGEQGECNGSTQGYGKTTIAHRLVAHLGCAWAIDEWSPTRPLLQGALHLTSEPVTVAA